MTFESALIYYIVIWALSVFMIVVARLVDRYLQSRECKTEAQRDNDSGSL
jgi:hypothetical protein